MRGKLIVIAGTDCSGKETQTNLLYERFKKEGKKVMKISFPVYDSPTGIIIGRDFLGKPAMGKGLFKEKSTNVNPLVASLYYAADRKYHIEKIEKALDEGYIILSDRYTSANLGFQAGKIKDSDKRKDLCNRLMVLEHGINDKDLFWKVKYILKEKLNFEEYDKFIELFDILENGLLSLPKPDKVIFLHMPTEKGKEIRMKRKEKLDQNECDDKYLKEIEKVYLELQKMYDWEKISCISNDKVLKINDINEKIYNSIKKELENTNTKTLHI